MKKYLVIIFFLLLSYNIYSQSNKEFYVCHLTTDMIEHTNVIFQNGVLSNKTIYEYNIEDINNQIAEIHSAHPHFGWQIVSKNKDCYQTKYRILVASSVSLLQEGVADLWDSGIVEDNNSVNVVYNGKELTPETLYFWKVKIYDNKNNCTKYSSPKGFITSCDIDETTSMLPLQKTEQIPNKITHLNHSILLDFGKDAFSQLKIHFNSLPSNKNVTIHLGEVSDSTGVCKNPGGSRRYAKYTIQVDSLKDFFEINFRKDKINTNPNYNESGVSPIIMPNYIGEVYPFRYCQIEGYNGGLTYNDVIKTNINYPFNEYASDFNCSDTILNQIWDLCKHSMKATSFCGMFVDGDRERIPYEADAMINQLSYFVVNNNYSISRATLEHLIFNPTWPTEWILQTLIIAWNDYLYSGNDKLIKQYYSELKNKTLMFLRNNNDGLLYTGNKITNFEDLNKVNFKGKEIRDIVDWPMCSTKDNGVYPNGEDDYYDRCECKTVVNAFHYQAMILLAKIAQAIGNNYDADIFNNMALTTKKSINSLMIDSLGVYVDGLNSNHKSLHANMFPLAFNMVDSVNIDSVTNFIESKGMVCSVYGAQFLLDALFDNNKQEYAFSLLTDTTNRSWYNMIKTGSTITTEAWDNIYKPNQDWNHAWGAAAGNIIARKVMGIEPLSPGFKDIKIAPYFGNMTYASIKYPTPRGNIVLEYENKGNKLIYKVSIPPNSNAQINIPGIKETIFMGSGKKEFKVSNK
ncbi:MAG: alpha-L-rhamnosidase [Bacteroidales bacterium]|nr:alpha-L-rhamnosidase [Bacteroidales bacterium]